MTEQLLFIDNKAMDINESTNITLNFRSNIFSDVSKITSNNTYSIKQENGAIAQLVRAHDS